MEEHYNTKFKELDTLLNVCGTENIIHIVSLFDGFNVRYSFPNGYGATIICHKYSYGGNLGLYEMACWYKDEISYNTDFGDNVRGSLKAEEVKSYLEMIKGFKE